MKTFISSTYEDLVSHRDRVAQAIERLGHQGIRMEVFGARPAQATDACFDEIKGCNAFVGLYAHRYGFVPSGAEQSITEMELDFALKIKLPIFCYVIDEEFPWMPRFIDLDPMRSKLKSFKERVGTRHIRDTFTTADDLAFKVAAALGRFLTTEKIKNELRKAPSAQTSLSEFGLDQVARRSVRISEVIQGSRLLLVNDYPDEMQTVIHVLEELKLSVEIAKSTTAAVSLLENGKFDLVISDMMRDSNERAGLNLLNEIRVRGLQLPVIFTVGRFNPERGTPPLAFGITNRMDELLNLIFDALERSRG
jgi:CheY-like chemotaxis protein